jgi:uncharacterized protein (TIGR00730 family)
VIFSVSALGIILKAFAFAQNINMDNSNSLKKDLEGLIDRFPTLPHSKWISRALSTIIKLAEEDVDRLDWKILSAAIEDMRQAFQVFYDYRHVRKIAVFGSARTPDEQVEYQMARQFAQQVTKQGFMVITGAGGGIMEAANQGAGKELSFGLNIKLPYEQGANSFIEDDPKLMRFKYFFTRKLFFLRESDAIALFPGGFGTHDEALECLTLCQTSRHQPIPMILIDKPGGSYWRDWDAYIRKHLVANQLISAEDTSLYTVTDNLDAAYNQICNFYQVYHSSRYVKELLVIRLKQDISEAELDILNQKFADILASGKITRTKALAEEVDDPTEHLPRLLLHFNQRDSGRLYQMIQIINQMGQSSGCDFQPHTK